METFIVGVETYDEKSDLVSKVGSFVGFSLGGTGSEVGYTEGVSLRLRTTE